jgi:hypothetical protein
MALKRLKTASEASSNKATQTSAKTIFSKRLISVFIFFVELSASSAGLSHED